MTKRKQIIERRLFFLSQLERTQKITTAVENTVQKFGCSQSAAWQDAMRMPEWIDTIVKADNSNVMVKRLFSGLRNLVPNAWLVFAKAINPPDIKIPTKDGERSIKQKPNLNVALGAINTIARIYIETAKFLQSVGIVYKAPEQIEVDHAGEILVEVETQDEADILAKAARILARKERSRKLH